MVNIKECYREIVREEPEKRVSMATLVQKILTVIDTNPQEVNKQLICLFFVDLFQFSSLFKDQDLMPYAVGVLKHFASAQGFTLTDTVGVSEILAWLIYHGE